VCEIEDLLPIHPDTVNEPALAASAQRHVDRAGATDG